MFALRYNNRHFFETFLSRQKWFAILLFTLDDQKVTKHIFLKGGDNSQSGCTNLFFAEKIWTRGARVPGASPLGSANELVAKCKPTLSVSLCWWVVSTELLPAILVLVCSSGEYSPNIHPTVPPSGLLSQSKWENYPDIWSWICW